MLTYMVGSDYNGVVVAYSKEGGRTAVGRTWAGYATAGPAIGADGTMYIVTSSKLYAYTAFKGCKPGTGLDR
jgi:hypothetical protein